MLALSGRRLSGVVRLVDLFLPRTCPACGMAAPSVTGWCFQCALYLRDPGLVRVERTPPQGLAAVVTAAPLSTPGLAAVVHRLKYEGELESLTALCGLLHFAWVESRLPPCEVIVPVPLHTNRLRRRGFNQSAVLGRGLSQQMGIPQRCLLRRRTSGPPQVGLGASRRRSNLTDAFTLGSSKDLPESVLLVDDVMTTGTTLSQAALCIRRGGVEQVFGLAVARSELPPLGVSRPADQGSGRISK